MGKKAILICEEKGCPDAALKRMGEINGEEPLSEIYLLKVIPHPPMQFCEHGGADSGAEERRLDAENRRRQQKWHVHEEKLHGPEVKGLVERLKGEGLKKVKVRFLEKEISFSNSVISELKEGGYDIAVMSEKSWDAIEGKKAPSTIRIVTV